MMAVKKNNPTREPLSKSLLGLRGLESYVEPDTFLYLLRTVYNIIFKSSQLAESKEQLRQRIIGFEKDSALPGFMSAISIEQLLAELEDAQYFYPLRGREIELPTFH